LTATASGPLKLSTPDQVYSEAYFYAIFSAVFYFVAASLMLLTATGANKGYYGKDFKLTMSQRTLMLQTICFLTYLLIGALVFSHIEGWLFLDAVYWADVTLLTVGLGDYSPSTKIGRGLLFPYAIGGIITIGLVVDSIRSLVLERGKVKLDARILERQRKRLLKHIGMKHDPFVLTPVEEEIMSSHTKAITERERRQMEFYLMRKVQARAASRGRWMSLMISASTWFVLWFAGAAVFRVRSSIFLDL
jgi:potassium channel subfamily K, other eukaryote